MLTKRWFVVYEVRVEVEGPDDEAGALKLARGKVAVSDDQVISAKVIPVRRVMRAEA